MYCPRCEAETSVESSINTITGNGFKHNRKCVNPECAHRFHTIEIPYDNASLPIIMPLLELTRKTK